MVKDETLRVRFAKPLLPLMTNAARETLMIKCAF
jgi:hypothetical protein